MYVDMAPLYSTLFPLPPERIDFTHSYLKDVGGSILDIGCANGDFPLALASRGYSVTAIDSEDEMIREAEINRGMKESSSVLFFKMGMLETEDFEDSQFHGITCFGNTLPHLYDLKELDMFFRTVHRILRGGGIFIAQTVNFDRILLSPGEYNFPDLSAGNIIFKRKYTDISETAVTFETEFIDPSLDHPLQHEIQLLPVKSEMYLSIGKKYNFKRTTLYGSYSRDPFTEDSEFLLCVMEK